MPKTFQVEVQVPEGLTAGDIFRVEVELPTPQSRGGGSQAGQRGRNAGIPLEEMTIEELKREITNANSVLYKAKLRGAADEVIERNQARVDAVKAEKERRTAMANVAAVLNDEIDHTPLNGFDEAPALNDEI